MAFIPAMFLAIESDRRKREDDDEAEDKARRKRELEEWHRDYERRHPREVDRG